MINLQVDVGLYSFFKPPNPQVDGEPWVQDVPSARDAEPVTVEISKCGSSRVLRNVGGLYATRMSRKWARAQHDNDGEGSPDGGGGGCRFEQPAKPSAAAAAGTGGILRNVVEVQMADAGSEEETSLDPQLVTHSSPLQPYPHPPPSRHASALSAVTGVTEAATNVAQAGSSYPSSMRTSFSSKA